MGILLNRAASQPPAPDSVREDIIERCRQEVESGLKRRMRNWIAPLLNRKHYFAELGEGFQWGRPFKIGTGSRVGRYVYIGAGFEAMGVMSIGDLTMISTECKLIGADHLYDVVGTPTRLAFAPDRALTVIGADVWIGMRATIREGVVIGRGAVVGSGSLVTKDVAPYTVVAGVPARVIKQRFTPAQLVDHEAKLFA